MITGLFETHINVANLERSMAFYETVLGLELGIKEEGRRVAFYWVGGRGEAMLGLWEKPADQILPQHFAFRSTGADVRWSLVGCRPSPSIFATPMVTHWNLSPCYPKRRSQSLGL